MTAFKCERCEAVWLSQVAQQLASENDGCLRCDGPLRPIDPEEAARLVDDERD